ncbi:NAD-dependent epimerase/dehydratase family protein [Leifsonia aquatica]|uniref:NAD dependent epimerase/dehydratase family protein n=2 Tax=Leifsonia aquatica TaxID=144185 RepID=U2SZJ0_LEIAQ|nr:NAD(P)-dependent oxidoreductase [Leifsonia aquatica]ERK70673.1 NAD dependent epimerase/dehydratase family protein [Leifsonia aquatica ATCC 14665]MBB2968479.1 UDP-glucose 4-epimerase [Leifsonia aquatica]
MQIAVTGASGRVGRAVTAQLVERGHHVIGLDLVAPRDPVSGADYLVGDLVDLPRLDPRLAEVEAVAHLGAYMSWNPAEAEKVFAANVTATQRLIRALGPSTRRFVLASTGEVYPENAPAYQPLDEDHPRSPTTWYGVSKVLAEELVAFAGRDNHWDTVVLRFSHTQDPAEILDPDSFFSGPRFFASRRIEREGAAGNSDVVATLEPYAGDDETLLVASRADGAPVQMGILATPDLAAGVVLALEVSTKGHQVIGLGPDESTDLGLFARELAEAAGLRTVEVTLPVTAPSYTTSNARARELLGFRPAIDRAEFVRRAVEARRSLRPR